jgi:predicted negative regulator of RcsB-dependent stress response
MYAMREHQMREFIRLVETDIEFQRDASKVVANLKSYESQVYTKLAQKVQRIEALESEIKQLKQEVKSESRQHVAALFTAEDTVRTRVVETVSFILTLSKDPKPTESYKYAKIIEELEKQLTPELIAVLENLKTQFKTVTQKEPSLSVTKIDESIRDKIKSYMLKYMDFIRSWAGKYDQKLDTLKRAAGVA